ncbi:hypothetical protein NPIL_384861 [Nephila pilipes]|uniref:Uncharacterized protein n=1 Tax=Nephila pilipes TaxID=299642 RepID=A0A8X6QGP0_NEPPI|nr:hypothetical protein NPIL_384861 [Nephila pilipes]
MRSIFPFTKFVENHLEVHEDRCIIWVTENPFFPAKQREGVELTRELDTSTINSIVESSQSIVVLPRKNNFGFNEFL